MRVVALLLVCGSLVGQSTQPEQQQNPAPPPNTVQHPVQPANPPPPVEKEAPPPDHQITPEEAKELLGAVDGVLRFDSGITGLPIKSEVKRRLVDRDEVQAYVEKEMREDEDAQRLKNGEVVLKKFGLVPRDFDVDAFLVKLLREQVAGYYDPKTKFVNLLNWLQPEVQMPVLAHELTHALQDQSFGMEKWVKGPNHKKHMTPAETIADDETTVARHAVLEGQAMAVMLDWMLAPAKKTILDAPLIVDAMEAGMASGGDSPVYQSAPLYLQRMLIFPYTYGLDFERTLLKQGGKEKAFEGVFQHPPISTREVMEPKVYLDGEHLAPLDPPNIAKILGKGWEMYDVGSIGEFDVAEIAEQFSNRAKSKEIYPGWRGGYYYAMKQKGKTVLGPQDIGMVFVTRWGDPKAEASFADVYSGSVGKRYPQVTPVAPASNGSADAAQVATHWKTGEGDVFVEAHGDILLIMESLDEEQAAKVRAAILK